MSSRGQYFESLKTLARKKRETYGIETARCGLREIRRIYSAERIKIDRWPLTRSVKAVYMCEDGNCSVAIQPSLPKAPKLFALVHELKHHYCDQALLKSGVLQCGDYNANEQIEVGAEVFAAEFLYPENEFERDATTFWSVEWNAEAIVRFKKSCPVTVSYTFLRKRLEWLRLINPGQYDNVQFQKLEHQIFGEPFYKQKWFKEKRKKSAEGVQDY